MKSHIKSIYLFINANLILIRYWFLNKRLFINRNICACVLANAAPTEEAHLPLQVLPDDAGLNVCRQIHLVHPQDSVLHEQTEGQNLHRNYWKWCHKVNEPTIICNQRTHSNTTRPTNPPFARCPGKRSSSLRCWDTRGLRRRWCHLTRRKKKKKSLKAYLDSRIRHRNKLIWFKYTMQKTNFTQGCTTEYLFYLRPYCTKLMLLRAFMYQNNVGNFLHYQIFFLI